MSTQASSTSDQQSQLQRKSEQTPTVIIYCDGSFHRKQKLAGIGYVIKTRGGVILEEHHSESIHAQTSTQKEANACLTAVRAAQKYSPSHLILYSDCDPVVDKIKTDSPVNQRNVYHRIRQELDYIKDVSIHSISRNRNNQAHELAHLSLRKLKDRKLQ